VLVTRNKLFAKSGLRYSPRRYDQVASYRRHNRPGESCRLRQETFSRGDGA